MKSYLLILLFAASVLFAHGARASGGGILSYYDLPSYFVPDFNRDVYEGEPFYSVDECFKDIILSSFDHANEVKKNSSPEEMPEQKKSNQGNALYREAADHFYMDDYDGALEKFRQIEKAQDSIRGKIKHFLKRDQDDLWSIEAATYMIARTLLVKSQRNWDGYDDPVGNVNAQILSEAELAYDHYLKKYPDGKFANSARHIKRKIYYLSGRYDLLKSALKREMREINFSDKNPRRYEDTINEFVRFSDGGSNIDVQHDALSVILYAWMKGQKPRDQDIATLDARKAEIGRPERLFQLTRAFGLYQLGKFSEVVEQTENFKPTNTTVDLSLQFLRAKALVKLDRLDEAQGALVSLYQAHPEDYSALQLSYVALQRKKALDLFADHSPKKSGKILSSIAHFGLSRDELEAGKRQHSEQRHYLVEELAVRFLHSGEFDKLDKLISEEKGIKFLMPIRESIAQLHKNPSNSRARLEVAKFTFDQSIFSDFMVDQNPDWSWSTDSKVEFPCPSCGEFRSYRPPFEEFLALANSPANRNSDIEAESLHCLVRCFKGSYYQSSCKWDKDYENQSKKWFSRLHSRFSGSDWAKKTPYYY